MNMKKETKVLCPQCGAELGVSKDGFTAVAAVVGKKSRLDQVYKSDEVHKNQIKKTKTTQERIDALRNAGIDVSNLFAMRGTNGGDYVVSYKNGKLAILDDDDPILNKIIEQGTVPNKRLFRRWVMAQMFHMMSRTDYYTKQPVGVTGMIHKLGYEYQWKMLMDELYAQMKMEGRDTVNFSDRNRWFNADIVVQMGNDYISDLKYIVDAMKEKNVRGFPTSGFMVAIFLYQICKLNYTTRCDTQFATSCGQRTPPSYTKAQIILTIYASKWLGTPVKAARG